MENKEILKIIKKENVFHNPKIVSIKERKQSIFYEIKDFDKSYLLKIRKTPFDKLSDLKTIIRDTVLVNHSKGEWKSLNYFYKKGKQNMFINFIKPITYIKDINGVITKKVEGQDLWRLVKKNKEKHFLTSIGKGLKEIHKKTKLEVKFVNFKFKKTGNKKIDKKIKQLEKVYSDKKLTTIKSLPIADIRDVFISRDNKIYFLDTPPIKEDFIYRSIAYLIATLKIIHQGYLSFIFKKIDKKYENNLIKGYFEANNYDKNLLNLFILERLTVLYSYALNTLKTKKRFKLSFVKYLVKKFYIDNFYYREMNEIIKEIENENTIHNN